MEDMMSDRERRIQEEAYRIWVEAGRPSGGEEDHWLEAERRIATNDEVETSAKSKLDAPLVERKPKQPSKVAAGVAGAAAADAGKAATMGRPAQEAEAFATRRSKTRSDVEGATATPAPGPAGAKAKLDAASAKPARPSAAARKP